MNRTELPSQGILEKDEREISAQRGRWFEVTTRGLSNDGKVRTISFSTFVRGRVSPSDGQLEDKVVEATEILFPAQSFLNETDEGTGRVSIQYHVVKKGTHTGGKIEGYEPQD